MRQGPGDKRRVFGQNREQFESLGTWQRFFWTRNQEIKSNVNPPFSRKRLLRTQTSPESVQRFPSPQTIKKLKSERPKISCFKFHRSSTFTITAISLGDQFLYRRKKTNFLIQNAKKQNNNNNNDDDLQNSSATRSQNRDQHSGAPTNFSQVPQRGSAFIRQTCRE